MAMNMKTRQLIATTAAGVALGLPIALGIVGATQASAQSKEPTTLTCSADKTAQAVTQAIEHGTAVNNQLLSNYKSNLSVLQRINGDPQAIKECQRDVAALTSVNGILANSNNLFNTAVAEPCVLVGGVAALLFIGRSERGRRY